jgi:hypothetical protein
MSLPKLTPHHSLVKSGVKGISVSLGVALLLGGGIAQSQIEPNNVRIPDRPQEAEVPSDGEQQTANARFTCEVMDDGYTVMYHPKSQPDRSYEWAQPRAMGGGWSPDRRCNEIARRLEFYRPDGLQELAVSQVNNYDIICVTTQNNPECRIVLTVPPGEDATLMRDRVFENLTVADSGQQTDAVNAIVDTGNGGNVLDTVEGVLGIPLPGQSNNSGNSGNSGSQTRLGGINLQPFLDPADGGTGTQLNQSMPGSSDRQLDPDNF